MGWFNSLFSGLILAGFSKGWSGFRLVVLAMGVLGLVFFDHWATANGMVLVLVLLTLGLILG